MIECGICQHPQFQPTVPKPFNLGIDRRIEDRKKFDNGRKKRERAAEERERVIEDQRKKEEERELKEYRKTLVFKVHSLDLCEQIV